MQRSDPRSSGYRSLPSAPRGSSLFGSSASRDRGSHNSSRSPYASSFASHSSGPSNTPWGSSLFASSASRGRSSQDSSQSPYATPYASRSSGYGAPSNTPRGSSLFASSAPGSRGAQHSSRSPYTSSSPSSAGSYTSYNSAKSHLTDYKPRGGWFPSFGYRRIVIGLALLMV
jgi:hypothetical protein